MDTDNWPEGGGTHRCVTCVHYLQKIRGFGRCRRRAPTMAGFPAVYATDVCGEHEMRAADARPVDEQKQDAPPDKDGRGQGA